MADFCSATTTYDGRTWKCTKPASHTKSSDKKEKEHYSWNPLTGKSHAWY